MFLVNNDYHESGIVYSNGTVAPSTNEYKNVMFTTRVLKVDNNPEIITRMRKWNWSKENIINLILNEKLRRLFLTIIKIEIKRMRFIILFSFFYFA